MTAYYPGNIAPFDTHHNITEIIDASHPNKIQTEVVAVEATLGVNPNLSGAFNGTLPSSSSTTNPNVSSYIYTTTGTTFNTVADRITNVENLATVAAAGAGANLAINNQTVINLFGGY